MKNSFEGTKNQKSENREKSQTELREALNKRFLGMKGIIKQATDEYKTALQNGSFEDQNGEEEKSGESRKEALQNKISGLFQRAEKIKVILDSKEKLPNFTDSISATYTRPDKKIETITLSIEEKLEENCAIYKKTKLDTPPYFEDSIREIWENNIDNIQKAIEESGFNDVLLMPADLSLPDLHAKMTEGYAATYEGDNFKSGGSFAGAKSQNVDKPRIVLVHKVQNLKDNPELAKTLNIKGEDALKSEILTLEDYLVFQRKYFEETKKHLDEDGYTWLATKSGARFVDADWNPSYGQLGVNANDADDQSGALGARPSRSFF